MYILILFCLFDWGQLHKARLWPVLLLDLRGILGGSYDVKINRFIISSIKKYLLSDPYFLVFKRSVYWVAMKGAL